MRCIRRSAVILAAVVFGGCGSGTTPASPTTPPPTAPPTAPPTPAPLTAPQLLSPSDGATINQNDPTIGCPANRTAGYGFIISFDWAPVGGPLDSVEYELYSQHQGSKYPALDIKVSSSAFQEIDCNTYVANQNLKDWKWKVRAMRSNGEIGPWSQERTYRFAPCVIQGQLCGSR